jgi:hypothetical protein
VVEYNGKVVDRNELALTKKHGGKTPKVGRDKSLEIVLPEVRSNRIAKA